MYILIQGLRGKNIKATKICYLNGKSAIIWTDAPVTVTITIQRIDYAHSMPKIYTKAKFRDADVGPVINEPEQRVDTDPTSSQECHLAKKMTVLEVFHHSLTTPNELPFGRYQLFSLLPILCY